MRPLLELVGVTRRFAGVVALDRVDFDLRPGEVHALVGENGAGKSTLINLASGVLLPDEGSIRLDGRAVSLSDPLTAHRLGIVTAHQEADLFETLSVAENMALQRGLPAGRLGRVRWREVDRQARAALATLGEAISPWVPASSLSVGQRHMVQVAAAFAYQARIVILDEPTSALSDAESAWLFGQIERLRAGGAGVIYITHRQEEIFRLADRITVLRDGRRVWTGLRTETDRARLVQAMVGREEMPVTAGTTTRALSPRLRVRHLDDRHGRFHDVCLDVWAGEILGLYGLIGAGRSEWAQAIFGWRPCAGGSVELDGRSCLLGSPAVSVQQGIAYVPEDRLRQGVFAGLSVRANTVISALRSLARGGLVRRAAERAATRRQVDALGIRMHSIEQPIHQLSGGNQQKVILGRWLLLEPRVLILDEPTRGIDVAAKAEIHRLVRAAASAGCAVILISSELPEILSHTDRVAVFRQGRVAGVFETKTATAVELAHAALPQEERLSTRAGSRAPRFSRLAWSELGLLTALALLGLGLALSTHGRFLTYENLFGVASNASVMTILALGSAAVLIAGGIDISVGSLLALSAAAGGLVLTKAGPPVVAIPLGVLLSLAVGLLGGCLNAVAALVGRIHPIVVTLGTLTIYRGLLLSLTGGEVITDLPAAFRGLATARWAGLPGSVAVWMMVAVVAHFWLTGTRSGRHLFALGSSPRAARLVGVRRGRVWLTAFGFGGLCAALAGLLELAQNGSMQSSLGTGYELRAIAAAVIGGTAVTGGRGSVAGVVLGALLLSVIQNALVLWSVSRYRYDLVIGSLLLAAVLIDLALRRLRA